MSFSLHVEFAGLCFWIRDRDNDRATVLMPDCRYLPDVGDPYPNLRSSEYHAGYLRYNLADAFDGVPFEEGPGHTPRSEGIFHFAGNDVDFDLAGAAQNGDIALPELKGFSYGLLQPRAHLLDADVPASLWNVLLMRTTITGGQLSAAIAGHWGFSNSLDPHQPSYTGYFGGCAYWDREIEADEVTLTIRDWEGRKATSITLHPANGSSVNLKIANLCRTNPLEWPEIGTRLSFASKDEDFKWLYRLLEPVQAANQDILNDPNLPVPEVIGQHGEGSLQNCVGLVTTIS